MIFPLLLAAAAAVPHPGPLKLFRDWTVGCDNVRNCQAVALVRDQAAEDGLTMSLARGAAPDAPVRVVVGPPLGASDEKTGVAALVLDGKRLPARLTEVEGGAAVDPAGTAALLAGLRTGARLEALDTSGRSLGTISLAGASAALLYMDDQQQRIGTVTALVRAGPTPASAVPSPPLEPVVEVPPAGSKPTRRMSLATATALRKKACDGGEPDDGQAAETYLLDEGHTLALVPDHCDSGAYNSASLLYVGGETGPWLPAPYDLPRDKNQLGDEDALAYNADWDPRRGTLDMFMKGRGLGDCGTRQSFAWDGARFRLVAQAQMDECRGSIAWIPTWRAKVVRR